MVDKYEKSNDGYANVKNAILRQAAQDYIRALRQRDESQISFFEWWFKSEWGEFLSNENGAYIIEKCRKEVKGH